MTILLVDDERDTRTVARLALRQLGGFTVIEAASGREALEMAARERPDAVVLDVMMPGMDGPQVLAALRSDPATARLPVIFLTAKAMPDEVARLRSLGAAAILTKPFDPEALAVAVRDTLVQRGAGPPVRLDADDAAGAPPSDFVDPAALGRLRGLEAESGGDLMAELIDVFAANTPVVLARLRALAGAVGGADIKEAERLAHALKSSAATLGATGYAATARTIEQRARDGSLSGLGALLDEMSRQLDPLLDRLRVERARLI